MSVAKEDPFRPALHFTASNTWINDPNGLFWFEGEYHLFYQQNPKGRGWGNCSWGHAVSKDLLRWEDLPLAIPVDGHEMAFSGSAVVDRDNTTGFHPDGGSPLVAIYTGHLRDQGHLERQNLAWSLDRGRTWTRYSGNPVLDLERPEFRDPKVFWHESSRGWVMAVTFSDEQAVGFFGSANLKDWRHLSRFAPGDEPDMVWECCDLVPLPIEGRTDETRWTLLVSRRAGDDGRRTLPSYYTGDFDGKQFLPDSTTARLADRGPDFFAGVTWGSMPPGDDRKVWIGWMANFGYAFQLNYGPWAGVLSFPRELFLRPDGDAFRLLQKPTREIVTLRSSSVSAATATWGEIVLSDRLVRGQDDLPLEAPVEIHFEFTPGTSVAGLEFFVAGNGDPAARFGYDPARGELFLERGLPEGVNAPACFAGRWTAPLDLPEGSPLALQILIDHCTLEIFADEGRIVFSALVFPTPDSCVARLFGEAAPDAMCSLSSTRLRA